MKRLVAGLCLVLAVGACSSSSKSSSSSASDAAATTAAPSVTVAVTAAASAGVSAGGICGEKANLAALQNLNPTGNLQQLLTDADAALSRVKAEAPVDIKADVTLVANGFHSFYLQFKAEGFDITKLTPAQYQALQAPSFKAAADRIQAYLNAHCP